MTLRAFRYKESAFSPSVAGLFQLTLHFSLYGNFIQALEPGAIAPPDTKNAGQVFRRPSAIRLRRERKRTLIHGLERLLSIALARLMQRRIRPPIRPSFPERSPG